MHFQSFPYSNFKEFTFTSELSEQTTQLLLRKNISDTELRNTISQLLNIVISQGIQLDMQKAANEELQHANDDLCSLNSEFHLMNILLHSKLKKTKSRLDKKNADYENLLSLLCVSNTAFLTVDNNYQIHRHTNNLSKIIPYSNVKGNWSGKPITVFNDILLSCNFTRFLSKAIKSQRIVRIKKKATDGHKYIFRIYPLIQHHYDNELAFISIIIDTSEPC